MRWALFVLWLPSLASADPIHVDTGDIAAVVGGGHVRTDEVYDAQSAEDEWQLALGLDVGFGYYVSPKVAILGRGRALLTDKDGFHDSAFSGFFGVVARYELGHDVFAELGPGVGSQKVLLGAGSTGLAATARIGVDLHGIVVAVEGGGFLLAGDSHPYTRVPDISLAVGLIRR